MILSRLNSLLAGRNSDPERRRFRDTPVRNVSITQKREVSPVRLVGYFVGGILLANLVLMTSSAFRGHAAQNPAGPEGSPPRRGPVAAAAAERALGSAAATQPQTDALAPRDSEPEQASEPVRPVFANLCADAREKLVAGLTYYYMQRSRRPAASHDEVLESASASALLAGPADPASVPSGIPCAG